MANETPEPRALSAALAAPAFATRGAGVAMHVANRHVERWAPETSANRSRALRSLGFVDRLVAPWIETAQRSAGLRMFSQYASQGVAEREGGAVSWVFPRPWYQDELDWMAASRQVTSQVGSTMSRDAAPALLTTRGTYVPPAHSAAAMPTALYEFVAPSLSVAQPSAPSGVGHGGNADAYSPLVSLAAVQAAELMSRAVAPFVHTTRGAGAAPVRMTPALRNVLTTMLERAADRPDVTPTRLARFAPEMVTPPAPRASSELDGGRAEASASASATQLAEQYATERTQVVELQRIARQSAQRELAAQPARDVSPSAEPELRQRAAELQQRATAAASASAEQARTEQARTEQARTGIEQARIEERIAQRLAERTGTQRLHEQARSDAAAHARASALAPSAAVSAPARESIPTPLTERTAPAEVAAAMASLPAELAAFLGQRPGRAMHAIGELNDALRTVELMARAAASGTTFETTRGPRLMMPAGLGGLVAAVDRAPSLAAGGEPHSRAPGITPSSPGRVPTLPWLTGPRANAPATATSAFGATTSTPPVALTHVAWADRWLARFAGASPQSLGVLTAASASSQRMDALAAAAPNAIFVAPTFDADRAPSIRFDDAGRQLVGPAAGSAGGSPSPERSPERFDDAAETPDDVFAQIAAAATRSRVATPSQTFTQPSAPAAPTSLPQLAAFGPVDAIAQGTPIAPGAGLSAQLASSPFAATLRHLLALPAASSFDVRSLFGSALSATYLAGLLGPASHELAVASTGPSWVREASSSPATRSPIEWDAAYVSPEAEPSVGEGTPGTSAATAGAATADVVAAPLTTLRTALLSWNVDAAMPTFADAPAVVGTSQTAPITTATARTMIEAMSMPMLGDGARLGESAAWTAPGMVGERAHGWAVAQERSSSDLALDFVSPELVLAARVYGLGPAEAAQAARLAIAGPGQLTAMASTVDRTFVQAMAIEHDRRTAEGRAPSSSASVAPIATAYPTATGEIAAAIGAAPPRAMAGHPVVSSAPGAAFGVERRAPRGAFLWPSATVAALGMSAAAPDSQQSMSVAALELLAAQAVAEIGTFAALNERPEQAATTSTETAPGEQPRASGRTIGLPFGAEPATAAGEPTEPDVLEAAAALIPSARRARFDALYVALSQSSSGRTWSPAARAARALALAGRGPSDEAPISARDRAASAWDVLPVVYATELADLTEQPADQATATGGFSSPSADRRATGRASGRAHSPDPRGGQDPLITVDSRPGLGSLSARAGEALGSYVTPTVMAPSSGSSFSSGASGSRSESMSPAMRAPTAAQELVRTGRPAGRYGGGEVEIPTWFEAAARKMLDDRSGGDSGISMAELTLVTAAPSSHVAASTRQASAPLAPASSSAPGPSPNAPQIDIDKVANEVYRQILVLMDAARARNGEPYL